MNKYLEKVAQLVSEENKQVGKTFAYQTAAAAPAHLVGGYVGNVMGEKFLNRPAGAISRGLARAGTGVAKLGKPGRWLGAKMPKHLSAGTLGVGIGVAAAGGLADLAALKHSLHGKVKE